jgi:hypothetical protein
MGTFQKRLEVIDACLPGHWPSLSQQVLQAVRVFSDVLITVVMRKDRWPRCPNAIELGLSRQFSQHKSKIHGMSNASGMI